MATLEIKNVLGESLPVTHYYGDGSYDCPHCHYAIRADEGLGPCRNPWCIANPAMPIESARKIIADRAAREREAKERQRNHELSIARIEEWNKTQREERTARLLAAREAGYCITCLVKSSYRKEVRHRKECPYAR